MLRSPVPAVADGVALKAILPLDSKALWIVPSPDGTLAAVNVRLRSGGKKVYLIHLDGENLARYGPVRLHARDDGEDDTLIDEDQFAWGPRSETFCLIRAKQVRHAGKDMCYTGNMRDLRQLAGKEYGIEVRRVAWHDQDNGLERSIFPAINCTGMWYAVVCKERVYVYDQRGKPQISGPGNGEPKGGFDGTQPTWHPTERDVLAFVRRSSGRSQILVRRLRGDPVELGGSEWGSSNDKLPAWSPDGRRLAFYSDRGERGVWNLYWAEVRIGNSVVAETPRLALEDVYPTLEATTNYTRPCWAPNSQALLAFLKGKGSVPALVYRGELDKRSGGEGQHVIDYSALLPSRTTRDSVFVSRAGDLWVAPKGYVLCFIVDQEGRREGYIALANLRP